MTALPRTPRGPASPGVGPAVAVVRGLRLDMGPRPAESAVPGRGRPGGQKVEQQVHRERAERAIVERELAREAAKERRRLREEHAALQLKEKQARQCEAARERVKELRVMKQQLREAQEAEREREREQREPESPSWGAGPVNQQGWEVSSLTSN